MTILRVYPAGWALGEKLTSAQMNAVDTALTYALDKRPSETDTLESVVSTSGAGRLIDRYAPAIDADHTYLVSGNALIDVGSISADRTYTLGNTDAIAGDRITICNRSNYYVTINNAAATRLITLGSQLGDSGTISGSTHLAANGEAYWAEFVYTGSVWVLWKSSKTSTLAKWLFTSTGHLVVPWSCTTALVIGCGGGGGGAAGDSARAANKIVCGGSGGGGAIEFVRLLTGLVPGETLDVSIAAGGPGGAAGTTPAPGVDGGDTQIIRASNSSVLATWRGAQGGFTGPGNINYQDRNGTTIIDGNTSQAGQTVARYAAVAGGSPVRADPTVQTASGYSDDPWFLLTTLWQQGGRGISGGNDGTPATAEFSIIPDLTLIVRERGGASPQGYLGGQCGSSGNADGALQGGGPGGGGGAGPYGNGGNGGDGRDGNTGTAGGAAAAAGNNTGGGGGGGGASGGRASACSGGSGGAGGSGRALIIPIR